MDMSTAKHLSEPRWDTELWEFQNNLRHTRNQKGQRPNPHDRYSRTQLIQDQLNFQPNPGESRYRGGTQTFDDVQVTYIFHRFPPSVAPLESLKKTYIDNLLLETNHRGEYVVLRTITPSTRLTAVMSAVEDETGACDHLQIYNMNRDLHPKQILPEGQVVIIKEPFYKINLNRGTGIRVDHVSDVIFLDPDDDRIPIKWRPSVKVPGKTPVDWKEEGNAYYRSEKFYEAIKCYTKVINMVPDDDALAKASRLNRSISYCSTDLHEKAVKDAEYVLKDDPTNEKALFRAAKALYQGRRFTECKAYITTLLKTHSPKKETKALLLKTDKRLYEERTGQYDFEEMRRLTGIERANEAVKLDYADFIGPIEIQDAVGKGRGLFMTKDVKCGELLLCIKAFETCYTHLEGHSISIDTVENKVERGCGDVVTAKITQKLYNNPSTSKPFLDLYTGAYEGVQERFVDGRPIVDTFQVYQAQRLNNFACPMISTAMHTHDRLKGYKDGCGLWTTPSYINHACWGPGTVIRSFIGDMMLVRAGGDIKVGVEITFSYLNPGDISRRQRSCLDNWGFTCGCCLCAAEELETEADRRHRGGVLMKILEFEKLLENPHPRVLISSLPRVVLLVEALEKTYKRPSAEQPRHILARGLQTLTKIYRELKSHELFIETTKSLVTALAFDMEEDMERGKVSFRKYGDMSTGNDISDNFALIADAYFMLNKPVLFGAYIEAASQFHELYVGERGSFLNLDQETMHVTS
ncbi:hypothetical protein DFP73DRAFT_605292 [Morchella snyderi]|nr:hypothetical protein DFP73DRAFT_605292 [Morchella snyderi]